MTAALASRPFAIGAALLLLAFLGFFQFPGHTWLQSDTQIYVPMFERIEHSRLYEGDPLMGTMHVGLTIYDETAIWLRRATGLGFPQVLAGEQIAFRVLALWGVFLIVTSLGYGEAAALLVAACFGLGATIVGPAVLSIEYEPVPRGFSVAFLMLATGLALHGRLTWACAAATAAGLFHAPSTWPFWPLFAACCWKSRNAKALWPLAAGSVVLAVAFILQPGLARPQQLFQKIDPVWEAIMRLRVAYDWLDLWPDWSILNFIAMTALALAALWRIRPDLPSPAHWIFLGGFPILGVLSIGLSGILLDWWKWSLMAQVQPARAALFSIVFAVINCSLAAVSAAHRKRAWEALLWFLPVFLVPVKQNFTAGFTPPQWIAIAVLAALAAVSLTVREGAVGWALVAVTACWMIPVYAGTVNYPVLHNQELDQLSNWARANTPESAQFEFAVAQRSLEQGVFRVQSLRPLWIDWKAGGQANYFRDFAVTWWSRWKELSSGKLTPADWRARGVRFLVYSGSGKDPLEVPAFTNGKYRVYDLNAGESAH